MQQFLTKTGKVKALATGDEHAQQSGAIVVNDEVLIGIKVGKAVYDELMEKARVAGKAVEIYVADILSAKKAKKEAE